MERTILDITPEEVKHVLETQTKYLIQPGDPPQETILGVPKDVFLAKHEPLKWKARPVECVKKSKS